MIQHGPAGIPAATICCDPSHLAAKLSPQVEQRHKAFKQQLLRVRSLKSTFFSLRFLHFNQNWILLAHDCFLFKTGTSDLRQIPLTKECIEMKQIHF